MKTLIKHLLATNLAEIVAKSRLHCHTRNVHSVVLLEAPGKTIRLFVAERGHQLYKNTPDSFGGGMSVGFHAHHCELTIACTRGSLCNWTVEPVDAGAYQVTRDGFPIESYRYASKLKGDEGGFTPMGAAYLRTKLFRCISAGESVFMPASEIHTVGTHCYQMGETIAWLVFEGREDPKYSPITYSTAKLDRENFSDLYQEVDADDVMRLLNVADLL